MTMKWRFIAVPLATAFCGTGALMLVLYVFAKGWDGGGASPWLEGVARWDGRVLIAPLKVAHDAFPALHRHGNPLVITFVLYGLIGLALVSLWEGVCCLIRRRRRAEPEGPCYGSHARRT